MPRLRKYTPVKITWLDSHSTNQSWTPEEEIDTNNDWSIESVGIFIEQNKTWTAISTSRHDNPLSVGGVFYIPTKCITSIQVLIEAN